VKPHQLVAAWGTILKGHAPLLSIEITRECPLHCPGCYAYGDDHLGGQTTLRDVHDYRGDDLVHRVIGLVKKHRPLHISLVGGEPLVRHRELSLILPELSRMGKFVLVVTSAVIPIPLEWMKLDRLTVAVSIDGLPAEHDVRRTPATYERILRNIEGRRVNVHTTVTQQMLESPSYMEEFLGYWNARPELHRLWLSLYTPQLGEESAEKIKPESRRQLVEQLPELHRKFPKLLMTSEYADALLDPPKNPSDCMFSRFSVNYTADLATRVEPCIFGGKPDCTNCGCAVSSGFHGIRNKKLAGPLKIGNLVGVSEAIGAFAGRLAGREADGLRGRNHSVANGNLIQIR
jgi:MoaA/NifB/PqqE/SkfB family radical SAM enzyme